jgi:hypothetical protein
VIIKKEGYVAYKPGYSDLSVAKKFDTSEYSVTQIRLQEFGHLQLQDQKDKPSSQFLSGIGRRVYRIEEDIEQLKKAMEPVYDITINMKNLQFKTDQKIKEFEQVLEKICSDLLPRVSELETQAKKEKIE